MVRSKVCFKCKAEKPVDEFYRHPQMGDGYLGKCKECTKRDVMEHREKNIEKIRAYDRMRASRPERRKHSAATNKRWRAEDSRRARAHNAVTRAIRAGTLARKNCERCGAVKSEAHHDDYDYPLTVIWLCSLCHKQRHKEIRAAIKAAGI